MPSATSGCREVPEIRSTCTRLLYPAIKMVRSIELGSRPLEDRAIRVNDRRASGRARFT